MLVLTLACAKIAPRRPAPSTKVRDPRTNGRTLRLTPPTKSNADQETVPVTPGLLEPSLDQHWTLLEG